MTHEDFIEEEPRTTPVCALSVGYTENVTLDLVLDEGEPVSFAAAGSGDIHLTGYFVCDDEGDSQDLDSIGMFEEDSEDDTFDGENMEEDSEEEDEEDDEPRVEEIEDNILEQAKLRMESLTKKRKNLPEGTSESPAKKKQKKEEKPTTPTKNSPKKETPKKETPKKETPKKDQSPKQTRVQQLRGGTVAEIITPGRGSQGARPGQKVTSS